MVDARYKICIFGDGGVGKTTLTQRFLTGVFEESYLLTIGMDFYVKKVDIEGKKISLQIWDFAGEEKFRFLMPSCCIGAAGAIFMYDTTRYASFKNLNDWLSVFRDTNEKKEQDVPAILVGSKIDLEEMRSVAKEDAIEMAKNQQFSDYIECSSKSGVNVHETFEKIARIVAKKKGLL